MNCGLEPQGKALSFDNSKFNCYNKGLDYFTWIMRPYGTVLSPVMTSVTHGGK
jgi:hypothetical protein